jgi:serine phosphatase RsbU (regulator of sigma subunit)
MLVLLTDGFYEWDRPDGEQFGTERIADLIREHHHLPAAEFIRVVYRTVVEFSAGTRQGDDLTAVIVRRVPAG